MFPIRSKSLSAVRIIQINPVRNISGYKINSENYIRKTHEDNYTDEDIYQEKIYSAVLKKARSPLRGFEKINELDIWRRSLVPNPNEPFLNNPDLLKYGSIYRYWRQAERERKRHKREGVEWKTLYQLLKEQKNDPKFVNIGLKKANVVGDRKVITENRSNPVLEKASREKTLILNMEEFHYEWERSRVSAKHIRDIAHHYNVFRDLFGHGDFNSVVHMDVDYDCSEDNDVNPVYYGNELLPAEAQSQPAITIEADPEKLYTLLLTNPDEHLEDNRREYAHWLVGNIPSCDVSKGELLLDYIQPFPARGTGYHRMVFLLFQQEKKIDFTEEKREIPCLHLCNRDFSTFEFYRRHEDSLTPVSLRFFQCKWDDSVRETFHKVLEMPEPVYEYAKLSEKERLSRLTRNPGSRRTLKWLSRFLPKEPIYPDGSPEERELRIQAAVDASSYDPKPDRRPYPLKNVY